MMKRVTAVAIVGLLFGVTAVAQQTADRSAEKSGQKSMGDMMSGCQEHCRTTMKSMEQMGKSMDEAKASTDPAKVRAALDQAQKPLADMKEHMGMCMDMMKMMEKMHGGGMGMMSGSDQMGRMSGERMRIAMSTKELATVCEGKVSARNASAATYEGRTYYFCSKEDKEKFTKTPEKFVRK